MWTTVRVHIFVCGCERHNAWYQQQWRHSHCTCMLKQQAGPPTSSPGSPTRHCSSTPTASSSSPAASLSCSMACEWWIRLVGWLVGWGGWLQIGCKRGALRAQVMPAAVMPTCMLMALTSGRPAITRALHAVHCHRATTKHRRPGQNETTKPSRAGSLTRSCCVSTQQRTTNRTNYGLWQQAHLQLLCVDGSPVLPMAQLHIHEVFHWQERVPVMHQQCKCQHKMKMQT